MDVFKVHLYESSLHHRLTAPPGHMYILNIIPQNFFLPFQLISQAPYGEKNDFSWLNLSLRGISTEKEMHCNAICRSTNE